MASTYTVQNVIDFARPFVAFRPLAFGTGIGGASTEPALTIANVIYQTILGPPFCWRWNRATATFSLTQGTQDYAQSVSTFGFIERATLTTNSVATEVANVAGSLPVATQQQRPDFIAAQTDDNAGNITFRFRPMPDATYSAAVVYQKKAALLSALSSTWSPIPDEMGFIFNQGFLGLALLYSDDPRYTAPLNRFLSGLVGTAQGLTEMQKNIFVQDWLAQHVGQNPVASSQ